MSLAPVTEIGRLLPPHAAALAVLGQQLAVARQLEALSLQLAGSVVASPSRDAATRLPPPAANAVRRFLRFAGPALAPSGHLRCARHAVILHDSNQLKRQSLLGLEPIVVVRSVCIGLPGLSPCHNCVSIEGREQ